MFEDPGAGKRDAPAGYCSPACHQASKPAPTPKPARNASPRKRASNTKRSAISPASPAQRDAIRERACIVCRAHAGSCHPAHLIDRSLCGEGADDPKAVVALCPSHHREYDEGGLDLLPYLEPGFREEQAFAALRVGLWAAVRRITNDNTP